MESGTKQQTLVARPDGKWKNLWREIYEEEWGEEETAKRCQTQFQFPAAGWGSTVGLYMETFKFMIGFSMAARRRQKRPSHPYGVAAAGFAHVLDNPDVPPNDFFIPGKAFRVRIRHGNFRNHDDDAAADGRSISLKFDDVTDGGPFDLLMNTGRINFFQNLPTFLKMVELVNEEDETKLKAEIYDRPVNLQATIEYLRRAPSSYTHLHYYSFITYVLHVTGPGNTLSRRHVRFRVVPDDVTEREESGLPDVEDQRRPWNYHRLATETRTPDYLREQYKEELERGPIKYHLEIQIHESEYSAQSDRELFNTSVEWDPSRYPWRRVAEIFITTPLSHGENEKTCFNILNRPECLAIPHPASKWDYNSLPYVRQKVYPRSQAGRRAGNDLHEGLVTYRVTVKTENTMGAGTDSDICISIIGDRCRTEPRLLDVRFRDDFERGSKNVFTVEGVEVGELLAVEIYNKCKFDDLNLNHVIVCKSGSETSVEFPCGSWIGRRRILPRGTASMVNEELNGFLRHLARYQLTSNQESYPWRRVEGLPSHVDCDAHSEVPVG